MTTRIYLTGRLAVEHAGELILDEAAFPGRQGRLVFAYLAVDVQRPVPRAELTDVLWGDSPPREAETTLSAVLSRLRALLRRIPSGASMAVQNGTIALRFPLDAWLDVEGATNAIDEAEGARRRGDQAAAWSHANIAAAIARRPFLPSEEAPWIERQRQSLSTVLLRSLQCLAAPRRVRLDPSSTLGRAVLGGGVVVGPEGGSALPVRVAGRTVAVLELGAPAIALKAAALAGLLGLAQWPLSRRGSRAAAGDAPAPGAEARSGQALHDNAGLTSSALRAMPIPVPDHDVVPQSPAASGGGASGLRLDPGALARLAELDPRGENQLVRRVLSAFATSAARLMPQFEAARGGPDLNALRYVAHTLKSSSASIGAMALSATCAEVESRVRTATDSDGLEPLLDTLSAQVAEVLAEIDALLGAQA